jgi:hypothetical protein
VSEEGTGTWEILQLIRFDCHFRSEFGGMGGMPPGGMGGMPGMGGMGGMPGMGGMGGMPGMGGMGGGMGDRELLRF